MENEQKVDPNTIVDDTPFEVKKEDFTQGDLIQQWREALDYLKRDVDVVKRAGNSPDEKMISVIEDIDYLDKKNTLLDENDDFILSDSGFLTYQTKHRAVFDYLSQLVKPSELETKSKFYFVSRRKHIDQQLKRSNWMHSLGHFLFIPVVVLVLVLAGSLMVKQTQGNSIVSILLILFCILHLKAAGKLLKPFKKTATTPFKFRVSLLGIHSLNTLLKVILLCFIPIIAAAKYQHYWIDDVIIISLSILCFFHFKVNDEQTEQAVVNDLIVKEATND